MNIVSRQYFTTAIFFATLLFTYLFYSQSAFAHLAKCEGLGFVHSISGDYGTIYVTPEPIKGRFPRLGYLPAGTVVELKSPFVRSKESFQKQHCGFTIGAYIRGNLDRRFIRPLDKTLDQLRLNKTDIEALIVPANPDVRLPLQIFSDKVLTEVSHTIARGQESLILMPKDGNNEAQSVNMVWFLRDGSDLNPSNLETGYIAADHDRDLSLDGTFRRHNLNTAPPQEGEVNKEKLSWFERFKAFVITQVSDGESDANFSTNFDLAKKKLLTLAGCKRQGNLSLELKASAGFTGSILGASAEGGTSLTLSIDDDEVVQFANKGNIADIQLSISGLTKCDGRQPFFLKEADIVVSSAHDSIDDIRFTVVRSEFFNFLKDEPTLKERLVPDQLERRSRISNIRGDMHPIIVVQRIPKFKEQHYWLYFDALERFLTNNVFDTVDVPRDIRFPMVLLTMEALSHWR